VDAGKLQPLHLEEIDGEPASHSLLVPALLDEGFTAAPTGFLRRKALPPPSPSSVQPDDEEPEDGGDGDDGGEWHA
jgi:hypothetical protein